MDRRAAVARTPPYTRLTGSIEEEDFPAAATANGSVYHAYVQFTHGDHSQAWPRQLREKPASFEALRRPTGGV